MFQRIRHMAIPSVASFAGLLPVWLAGCGEPFRYPAALQSLDPTLRVRAVKLAGERRDRDVLPTLVDRLEDEDDAVRFFAILALDRITGTRLGYDYRKPAPDRARAVLRWRNYVATPAPATQPATAAAETPGRGGS